MLLFGVTLEYVTAGETEQITTNYKVTTGLFDTIHFANSWSLYADWTHKVCNWVSLIGGNYPLSITRHLKSIARKQVVNWHHIPILSLNQLQTGSKSTTTGTCFYVRAAHKPSHRDRMRSPGVQPSLYPFLFVRFVVSNTTLEINWNWGDLKLESILSTTISY